MSMPVVTQLPVPCVKLSEGPHWLEKEQAVVYVDYLSKALRRHFINTGRHQVLEIDDGGMTKTVSFVIPVENEPELFIVGLGKTLSIVRWSVNDEDNIKVRPTVLQTSTDHTFNDAKCDPQGRLWAGTTCPMDGEGTFLEHNTCSLFKYDNELHFTQWVTGITNSNGLAWSLDRKTFYYIDSPTKNVFGFDYDNTEGKISNQRTLLNFEAAGLENQFPDGMTIDTDGNLWVACFGGSQVICIDPNEKKVIRQVSLPTKKITSVCWGGPNYDILYVTSAFIGLSEEEIKADPSAGGTFAISNLEAKGLPPINFKANLDKLKAKLAL